MNHASQLESLANLPAGSLRVSTTAERVRGEGAGNWRDTSTLVISGTSGGLRALAALLVQIADEGQPGAALAPAAVPSLTLREWGACTVERIADAAAETSPAVAVEVTERSSDAHRRDKLVVEVRNRLASTVRVTGFRFEADALKSAGNADLTILGGRMGRFVMFVPLETREVGLTVDGFTDLAGRSAPTTLGHREKCAPLPKRTTRSPLEDRIS